MGSADTPKRRDSAQWLRSRRGRYSAPRAWRVSRSKLSQVARHNSGGATSKNYFFQRFRIPATTYEVGDETDRTEIRDSAVTFADAFVEALSER